MKYLSSGALVGPAVVGSGAYFIDGAVLGPAFWWGNVVFALGGVWMLVVLAQSAEAS